MPVPMNHQNRLPEGRGALRNCIKSVTKTPTYPVEQERVGLHGQHERICAFRAGQRKPLTYPC